MQKRKIIFLFLVAAIFIYSGIAEAGLQYLPRYQGSYSGRNQSGGRDKVTITCASKGGVEKGANQTCTGAFSAGGKTCYKSCSCPSSYQYTVASHQGTGKLCASLSNACTINDVTKYSVCNLNTCSARNTTWIGESSKASYTSNNYACTSQNTSGKDGVCYVCACPSSWASGSCPANAASCSSCKAISPYTVNKFNLVSCKAGYYKNGNACTQCPAGSYCDGTNKNTCPAGSYSAAGASSCTACSAGQNSAAGASSCASCAAGTYAAAGSSTCSKCSAGTYSAAGATSCTSCSDGKYSTAGSSSCISCSPRKSNSTHTGCVDCTSNADCTKVSGGTCSGGSCTYPVVSCNSSTDRTNEKTACGATVAGYQCSACTSQAANGTQTAGQFNCSCAAKTLFPNGSAGSGSGGYLMTGANYGIDTLCDGWHIVCPNSGCKAGYYYSGGGCLACTGNTYSSAKATSCTACPAGQNVNADHTGCEAAVKTCSDWVKENYSGYTVYNGGSYVGTGKIAVLASGNASIANSGTVELVGPKFFAYEGCSSEATPTLTISNATKAFISADSVNLAFKHSTMDNSSCVSVLEACRDMSSGDSQQFYECMNNYGYGDNSCDVYSSDTSCCAEIASINPPDGVTGTMLIKNASVSSNAALFKVNSKHTLKFQGTSTASTSCEFKSGYGCRAIFAGGSSRTVKVSFDSGSTTSIKGAVYMYYSSLMEVSSGAKVNITSVGSEDALFVNQNGYTPTYYADQGVHNYGTIITASTGFHAGQVNNYSGSAFSTGKINSSSSGYPGRITYKTNSKIKIGSVCKIPSAAGEYKFTSSTSSNPLSGSSCTIN